MIKELSNNVLHLHPLDAEGLSHEPPVFHVVALQIFGKINCNKYNPVESKMELILNNDRSLNVL